LFCVLNDLQTVTSDELKMPYLNNELKWTAMPELCQKCFSVKRKRIRTENITFKSHCDSGQELLPKVTLLDTNSKGRQVENTVGKDCSFDPVSSSTSLTLTENLLLSTGCCSRTSISNDTVVCSSINTASMSATAVNTTPSGRNRSQNPSMTLQNNCLVGTNIAPQAGCVQPQFQNSVFKFDSQLKETNSSGCTVSSVRAAAEVDKKKDLDLHQCPLCDMVFDVKYVTSVLFVYFSQFCRQIL